MLVSLRVVTTCKLCKHITARAHDSSEKMQWNALLAWCLRCCVFFIVYFGYQRKNVCYLYICCIVEHICGWSFFLLHLYTCVYGTQDNNRHTSLKCGCVKHMFVVNIPDIFQNLYYRRDDSFTTHFLANTLNINSSCT